MCVSSLLACGLYPSLAAEFWKLLGEGSCIAVADGRGL